MAVRALNDLSLLATGDVAPEEATRSALPLLRDLLGAEDAYLVYGSARDFEVIALNEPPALNRTGLWLANRELTTRRAPCTFQVRFNRVVDFQDIESRVAADYVAALIPTPGSTAQMLLARGSWPDGLTPSRQQALHAALPAPTILLDRHMCGVAAETEHVQLGTLASIGRVIAQGEDPQAMLEKIAVSMAAATGLDYVSIDVFDREGGVAMRCVNYAVPQGGRRDSWREAKNNHDPVREEVIRTRQPMLFHDAQADPRLPDSIRQFFMRALIRSTAVFPLMAKDEVLGVISVASQRPQEFDERQVELLEGVAGHVAAALKGVQLYEERIAAEAALQRNRELLGATLESTGDGILVVDAEGKAAYVNQRFARMWRIPDELLATRDDDKLLSFVLDQLEDPDAFVRKVQALYRSSDDSFDVLRFKDERVFERFSRPLLGSEGLDGRVWSFRDVTAREQAQAALRQSEERFRSLVQNASDLITVIAPDTTILYQSPSSERVLGYPPVYVVGTRLTDLLHPDDAARMLSFVREGIGRATEQAAIEVRLRARDGSWRNMEVIAGDQRADAAIGGFVLNARDVTERRKLEEQLRYQAFHDPLTGLANRTRFMDRLEHALHRATRNGTVVGVLFMDLDDFKSVNDSLGHGAGDRLLRDVTARINRCLRPTDTAARFGGDEFALLVEDIAYGQDAAAVADRIFDALRDPFEIDGRELTARASIGIALSARGEIGADDLLRNADVAMYAAKARGKGRAEVYQSYMHASMLQRLELIGEIERGIERGEFVIHYQPMVALESGEIVGSEALVRWQHPRRGLVPPAQFIPLAEESGAILPLGNWVLNEACRQAARWGGEHTGAAPWMLSVNVSVRQIQQPSFADEVREALRDSGLPAASLILEITETVMLHDARSTLARLEELKRIGVRLAIDDFGTGYSSLNYLRQFPFDILKIDKSFVDGTHAGGDERDLARAIIDLGRTFRLDVVAEGIEHRDQLERLRGLDCGIGQGYYFARPLTTEQMDVLLSTARQASDAA